MIPRMRSEFPPPVRIAPQQGMRTPQPRSRAACRHDPGTCLCHRKTLFHAQLIPPPRYHARFHGSVGTAYAQDRRKGGRDGAAPLGYQRPGLLRVRWSVTAGHVMHS